MVYAFQIDIDFGLLYSGDYKLKLYSEWPQISRKIIGLAQRKKESSVQKLLSYLPDLNEGTNLD